LALTTAQQAAVSVVPADTLIRSRLPSFLCCFPEFVTAKFFIQSRATPGNRLLRHRCVPIPYKLDFCGRWILSYSARKRFSPRTLRRPALDRDEAITIKKDLEDEMTTLKEELESRVTQYDHWATRRRYGSDGPNNRRLWVLACMDERLPVDEALGIRVDTPAGGGDAHCFRNAGGIVTDDAIRSAMLTCNFFGTREIVIIQHTQCGMLSANAATLEQALRDKGVDPDELTLDPTLPELHLDKGAFSKWIGMMDDVDTSVLKTVEVFKNHPLIPKDVIVSGWVWEVETRRLRAPTHDPEKRARTDALASQFGVKDKQPPRWD
jgi:carbonic anhydrase